MPRQRDAVVTQALIDGIAQRDVSVQEEVTEILKDRGAGVNVVRSFAGGARKEVAKRTAEYFHVSNDDLLLLSERIREPLVEWLSEPLYENLEFFRRAAAVLQKIYWDKFPLGLVTQTESSAVWAQFQFTRGDGSSLWRDYQDVLGLVGQYEDNRGFQYAECAGDYERIFQNAREIQNPKTRAYHLLCSKLGVRPAETISFEDTAAGVAAAKAAGVTCIGLLLPGSEQELGVADLVVRDSLSPLIPFADVFAWADPMETIAILKGKLHAAQA